jgi:hypothetical protein
MQRYYSGSPKQQFAQAVNDIKAELMSRDQSLLPLEAHRRAIQLCMKDNPGIVKLYREDMRGMNA